MQQKNDDSFLMKPRETFGYLLWIAEAFAACLYLITRSKPGPRYPGMVGAVSAVMILVWAGMHEDPLMYLFFELWLGFLIFRRVESWWARWRGARVHSKWIGSPWMVSIFVPFIKREVTANYAEALLCGGAGYLLLPVSEPLGNFVMCCAASMGILQKLQQQLDGVRIQAEIDAGIDAEYYARQGR